MMKYIALFGLMLLSVAVHSHADTAYTTEGAHGSISSAALLAQYPAFAAEYAAYNVTPEDIQQLQNLNGTTVVVLFGSWCHDSEREVPRLLKLLQQSNVELQALQLEAVDRQKQHPAGLQAQYQLKFTPTIIVLRDGRELGRIIEQPRQSLAADIAAISAIN